MYLKYTTADSIYRQIELITHKNGEDIQFPDFPQNWDNTMNAEYFILNIPLQAREYKLYVPILLQMKPILVPLETW